MDECLNEDAEDFIQYDNEEEEGEKDGLQVQDTDSESEQDISDNEDEPVIQSPTFIGND